MMKHPFNIIRIIVITALIVFVWAAFILRSGYTAAVSSAIDVPRTAELNLLPLLALGIFILPVAAGLIYLLLKRKIKVRKNPSRLIWLAIGGLVVVPLLLINVLHDISVYVCYALLKSWHTAQGIHSNSLQSLSVTGATVALIVVVGLLLPAVIRSLTSDGSTRSKTDSIYLLFFIGPISWLLVWNAIHDAAGLITRTSVTVANQQIVVTPNIFGHVLATRTIDVDQITHIDIRTSRPFQCVRRCYRYEWMNYDVLNIQYQRRNILRTEVTVTTKDGQIVPIAFTDVDRAQPRSDAETSMVELARDLSRQTHRSLHYYSKQRNFKNDFTRVWSKYYWQPEETPQVQRGR